MEDLLVVVSRNNVERVKLLDLSHLDFPNVCTIKSIWLIKGT